jgi:hypothetical protein
VFERLIEDAHQAALNDLGWDNDIYAKSGHIEERILLLRDHLPTFLVQNPGLYVILSKGIHELSEDECGRYFPVVRNGIELILDEKIDRERREASSRRRAMPSPACRGRSRGRRRPAIRSLGPRRPLRGRPSAPVHAVYSVPSAVTPGAAITSPQLSSGAPC